MNNRTGAFTKRGEGGSSRGEGKPQYVGFTSGLTWISGMALISNVFPANQHGVIFGQIGVALGVSRGGVE